MKAAKALMVASAGVAVAVSVGLMALAIYLALSGSGSACAQRLDVPGNVLGAVLFGAGVLGLIGALADEGCLEWLFLCCSTALTLALLAYAAFALAVSTPSPSTSTGPAGQPVYTVTDFSPWLQGLVAQPDAWVKMWACLVANNSCPALPRPWGGAGDEMAGISHSSSSGSSSSSVAAASGGSGDQRPSVIQSGCCFPPTPCSDITALTSPPALPPAPSLALSPGPAPAPSMPESVQAGNHSRLALLNAAAQTNATALLNCSAADPGSGGGCFSCEACKAALLKVVRDDLWLAGCVCVAAACVLLLLLCVGGYAHVVLRGERRAKAIEEMRDEDDYSCGSLCSGNGSCGDCCECALQCCSMWANCLGECGR